MADLKVEFLGHGGPPKNQTITAKMTRRTFLALLQRSIGRIIQTTRSVLKKGDNQNYISSDHYQDHMDGKKLKVKIRAKEGEEGNVRCLLYWIDAKKNKIEPSLPYTKPKLKHRILTENAEKLISQYTSAKKTPMRILEEIRSDKEFADLDGKFVGRETIRNFQSRMKKKKGTRDMNDALQKLEVIIEKLRNMLNQNAGTFASVCHFIDKFVELQEEQSNLEVCLANFGGPWSVNSKKDIHDNSDTILLEERIRPTAKRRNRARCGICEGCRNQDCRFCNNCRDQKKYGGAGRLRKACQKRQCLSIKNPQTSEEEPRRIPETKSSQIDQFILETNEIDNIQTVDQTIEIDINGTVIDQDQSVLSDQNCSESLSFGLNHHFDLSTGLNNISSINHTDYLDHNQAIDTVCSAFSAEGEDNKLYTVVVGQLDGRKQSDYYHSIEPK